MHYRTALIVLLAAGVATGSLQSAPIHATTLMRQPLTVADTIRTARFEGGRTLVSLHDGVQQWTEQPIVYSPDSDIYATLLVRGDPEKSRISVELLTGKVSRDPRVARPRVLVTLYTPGLGDPSDPEQAYLTLPNHDPLQWLDDRHVAFLWPDGHGVRQVLSVDVMNGRQQQLTSGQESVYTFSATAEGDIVYATRLPRPHSSAMATKTEGLAVESADVLSLTAGDLSSSDLYDMENSHWLVRRHDANEAQILTLASATNAYPFYTVSISPDGRQAIVAGSPREVPMDWSRYQGFMANFVGEHLRKSAGAEFAARQVGQLYLVDLKSLAAKRLWDAPAYPAVPGYYVSWSPDARSVVLASAFTPIADNEKEGLEGDAFAVIDVATGAHQLLPMPDDPSNLYNFRSAKWLSGSTVEVRTDSGVAIFKKTDGRWILDATTRETSENSGPIQVCQGINNPPILSSVRGRCTHASKLLDPNDDLAGRFELGRAEALSWVDGKGRTWLGRLYLPVDYQRGKCFPLVIQTHGVPPAEQFSLYGHLVGSGPGAGAFAAQVLAGRGLAVLQLSDQQTLTGMGEAPGYLEGYESAISYLNELGFIDPDRVGLFGFSRTDWHVQYAITHSAFPFAAAVASDGISGGYVEETIIAPGIHDSANGGPPFGKNLLTWLKTAPAFNADHISAPLLLIQESGPPAMVISQWEMFSRLRVLDKPVELYLAPDLEHGSHGVMNPTQVLAVSGRAVDWFDFWLNGHEDSDPVKREQYGRWEKLCDLQRSDNPNRPTFCVPSPTH